MRLYNLIVLNAMAVTFFGLLAGVFLVFSLLGVVTLWPLPVWDIQVPGTTRGWQAAHVGGILNGVMVAVMALLMKSLEVSGSREKWIAWGMIVTGWGNTVFYWAGNLSQNRGLSVVDTPFGPGDIWGALAFVGGGVAMFFTFTAVILTGLAAYERLKESS